MEFFWLKLRQRYYRRHLRRKDLPDAARAYLQGFIKLDLNTSIAETEFVVFDTETTGFNVKKGDRIVSIGAVRLRSGRIDLGDVFYALVNPNRDIPSKAAVVHEILPRMVNGKPTIEEILPEFVRFAGAAVLVGHHAWLDVSFVNHAMVRYLRFPLQNLVIDTAILNEALTKKKFGSDVPANTSLGALAERYRVSEEERHSSLGDALITAQIFQNMVKQAQQSGSIRLKDLLRMAGAPPSPPMDQPGWSGT